MTPDQTPTPPPGRPTVKKPWRLAWRLGHRPNEGRRWRREVEAWYLAEHGRRLSARQFVRLRKRLRRAARAEARERAGQLVQEGATA